MATTKREPPLAWRPPKDLRDRLEALTKERDISMSTLLEELVRRGLLVTEADLVGHAVIVTPPSLDTRKPSAPAPQGWSLAGPVNPDPKVKGKP